MFESRLVPLAEIDRQGEAELQSLELSLLPNAAQQAAEPYRGFELPPGLWTVMLGSYALFFATLMVATGGSGHARFAVIVSALYTAMFFGTARAMTRQAGPEARSPLSRGKPLMTATGPMDMASVASQILVVPLLVALFGTAIALIVALVA